MNATEERQRLMEAAARIQQELALIREQLRPFSQYVADLIAGGDSLMLQAALEKDKGEVPKVTKGLEQMKMPEVVIDKVTTLAASLLPSMSKSKRACSLCRQPGHRAQNCPNAHTVREQKMKKMDAPKPKRTRRPLTEEERKQKVAILAKARAAKAAKKGKR
jgi:hypothetical protein